jgi:transposase
LAFETEMYQPGRFSNERQVSAMLGLAPRVRESGGRRKEGPLIKAGRGRLRSLLVEASWVWIRHDAEARKVYQRLVHNTGSPQKAIVGMARRMGLDLWRLLVRARAAA